MHLRRSALLVGVAVASVASLTLIAGAQASSVGAFDGSASARKISLYADIDATSPSDVWIVGASSRFGPTVWHWDGAAWKSMPIGVKLNPYGIAAVAPDDVWVVGNNGPQNAIAHWDGHAWSQVEAPQQPGWPRHFLSGVDAVSARSVFATGYLQDDEGATPQVLHWNGSLWKPVYKDPQHEFHVVSAASPGGAWAVGEYDFNPANYVLARLHGGRWSDVSPPGDVRIASLTDVAARSPHDVWVVGAQQPVGGLILHWDGSRWTKTGPYRGLDFVSAAAKDDAWVAGGYGYTAHWDGRVWTRVDNPLFTKQYSQPLGLVEPTPDDAWEIAWWYDDTHPQTDVLMHWNGDRWSFVRPG